MSQENVEVVRRYFEGTGGPLEGESRWSNVKDYYPALAAELWESDGDYYPVRKFPEARPCHGRDEIVALLIEIRSAWAGYRFEVKDAIAIGDDRVLVRGHTWTEGRASGPGAGRRHLPLLLAPARTLHQSGGPSDRKRRPSRTRTLRRDPRSRRAL